jgi:ABC-type nitrate/sulfonate/bicarbonate transport system substrate-binding protein
MHTDAQRSAHVETAVRLWPDDTVRDFQQRWREVQLHFVDDPRAAADEAETLVSEALNEFSTTVASRKKELDSWRGTDDADTEQMRTALRSYRGLLDRLVGV